MPTTLTVYPNAHVETTSVDGFVRQTYATGSGETWANIIAAPGEAASDDGSQDIYIYIKSDNVDGRWVWLYRSILLFDTSALPDNCAITSAVLSVYGQSKSDTENWAPKMNVYSSAPATDTALVTGDYDSLGTAAYCDTDLTYASFSTSGYNNFTLNAAGLAAISKTGITKFGLREVTYDVGATSPAWGSSKRAYMRGYSAEEGGDYRPKLAITYALSQFPTDDLARVTALIHRYDRRAGIYQLEMSLGDITSVMTLPYELTPRRATAEKKQEQDAEPVIEKATESATKKVVQKVGATVTNYTKSVLKKAGLYYPMKAAQRADEPAALTARTLEILEEREQEVQKLETQIAEARGAQAITERTRRIIRESPEAIMKLEEKRKKQWKFGDWFKLR